MVPWAVKHHPSSPTHVQNLSEQITLDSVSRSGLAAAESSMVRLRLCTQLVHRLEGNGGQMIFFLFLQRQRLDSEFAASFPI